METMRHSEVASSRVDKSVRSSTKILRIGSTNIDILLWQDMLSLITQRRRVFANDAAALQPLLHS